jgi:hypothetical protein
VCIEHFGHGAYHGMRNDLAASESKLPGR